MFKKEAPFIKSGLVCFFVRKNFGSGDRDGRDGDGRQNNI